MRRRHGDGQSGRLEILDGQPARNPRPPDARGEIGQMEKVVLESQLAAGVFDRLSERGIGVANCGEGELPAIPQRIGAGQGARDAAAEGDGGRGREPRRKARPQHRGERGDVLGHHLGRSDRHVDSAGVPGEGQRSSAGKTRLSRGSLQLAENDLPAPLAQRQIQRQVQIPLALRGLSRDPLQRHVPKLDASFERPLSLQLPPLRRVGPEPRPGAEVRADASPRRIEAREGDDVG